MSILDGFFSLGRGTNLVRREGDEQKEGITAPLMEEADVELKDEDLLDLKKQWEDKWSSYYPEVQKRQEEAERYWKGLQFSPVEGLSERRPVVDNAIFESLETFLPVATKRNPEPQVTSDDTPEGEQLSTQVEKMLVYQSDRLRFKLKLKKVTRYWALYFLGAIKVGWSERENDVTISAVRTPRLILDPDATIDESEYTGEYIGEVKRESVSKLVARFPKSEAEIKAEVDNKLGTMVQYTEWWTDTIVFWTLGNKLLGKAKNPHWNDETEQQMMDEFGQVQTQTVPGNNHFPHPKKPYIFLSVFNVGLHPFDDTSLIHQNLANQDLINKRIRQIDKNADNSNAGIAVSGDYFTDEDAARAAEAWRKGGTIRIPQGDVRAAVTRLEANQLPQFHYQSLVDYRQRLLDIFGTRGTTPSGTIGENTVRGKIITRASDESRIGGGISEYLEQVADQTYNWLVQLFYVYYDEAHYGSVLGGVEGQNTVALINSNFDRKLTISVKEGSLIPKDDVTRANQAVDLAASGKMALVDLYSALDFGNPSEMATRAWLEINAPHLLYGNDPRVIQAIQEQQQAEAQKQQQEQEGSMQQEQMRQQGAQQQIETKGRQQRAQSIESQLLKQVPIS